MTLHIGLGGFCGQLVATDWLLGQAAFTQLLERLQLHKHVPPAFKLKAFNCPHCSAFSNMRWAGMDSQLGGFGLHLAQCAHCSKLSCWKGTEFSTQTGYIAGVMILPDGSVAPLPHPDMPSAVAADYLEARGIVNSSPRGAAALIRLAIQKLCTELGETSGNINSDIGSLVQKGLPVEIQQALDVVRVVGNNAVHPGELSEEDIADVAGSLFELVNEIVEDRIARPKKLAALFARLPEGALGAIAKRDAPKLT